MQKSQYNKTDKLKKGTAMMEVVAGLLFLSVPLKIRLRRKRERGNLEIQESALSASVRFVQQGTEVVGVL